MVLTFIGSLLNEKGRGKSKALTYSLSPGGGDHNPIPVGVWVSGYK